MPSKISMNKLDKIIKACEHEKTTQVALFDGEESVNVEVKHIISPEDMTAFVCDVIQNLFQDGDDGVVIYTPERYWVSYTASLLAYYTNFKDGISEDKLTTICYSTGIVDAIEKEISKSQLSSLRTAIKQRVDNILMLSNSVYETRVSSAVEHLDNAANAFKVLVEQFSDVGSDKMAAIVENLANMTPDTLVDAVVVK